MPQKQFLTQIAINLDTINARVISVFLINVAQVVALLCVLAAPGFAVAQVSESTLEYRQCGSFEVLKRFYLSKTLGDDLRCARIVGGIHRWAVFQTCPYSGTKASFVYVYSETDSDFVFHSVFRLPQVRSIECSSRGDGSMLKIESIDQLVTLKEIGENSTGGK